MWLARTLSSRHDLDEAGNVTGPSAAGRSARPTRWQSARARLAALFAAVLVAGTAAACNPTSSSPEAAPGDTSPSPSQQQPAVSPQGPPTFDGPGAPVADLGVEVIAVYPHDDGAYTQGLVHAGPGRLYETTGRYGSSSLREVDIASGDVIRNHDLDATFFGEGLAVSAGRLLALTWREHTALAFDPTTFEQLGTYTYDTEGWGLCDDGDRLVMSDGSSTLTFRDQQTFATTGSITVTMDGRPLSALNELECVDGMVYANVYRTDQIVVVDPGAGVVVGRVDAGTLLDADTRAGLEPGEVLNGIAYDPQRGTFYLTGKHWPSLHEVRFTSS